MYIYYSYYLQISYLMCCCFALMLYLTLSLHSVRRHEFFHPFLQQPRHKPFFGFAFSLHHVINVSCIFYLLLILSSCADCFNCFCWFLITNIAAGGRGDNFGLSSTLCASFRNSSPNVVILSNRNYILFHVMWRSLHFMNSCIRLTSMCCIL